MVLASGGTVAVINPESPIAGTTITIPEKALPDGGVAVSISYTDTPPAPVLGTAALASKVFEFDAGGLTNFASPVSITVPVQVAFSPTEVPVVLYWSPSEQKFKAISPKAFDRTQGQVTFETSHFSTYAIGKFDPSSVTQKVDTGFRVGVNSLRRSVGGGSARQLGGALYSICYYKTKPAAQFGALFDQYVQGPLPNPSDLSIADELMLCLAVPLSPAWQGLQTAPATTARQAVDDLITALAVTNEPQLLMLSPTTNPNAKFVGVVYSYEPQLGKFQLFELSNNTSVFTISGDPDAGILIGEVQLSVLPSI